MIAALTALARRLAKKAWEVMAILDLFRRAAREKGRAFFWAGAYGAVRWDVSRRSADRLIHWLEELGHLEVLDRGDRHTPRTVRMHLIPLDSVDQGEIRKARLEVARRWDPVLACPHSTYIAAPALNSCPIALTDDPDPCRSGPVTADPFSAVWNCLERFHLGSRHDTAEEASSDLLDQTTSAAHSHLRLISTSVSLASTPPATATAPTRIAEVIR